MKLDLKLTYNRMSDDDLLAIVHSQADFRPGAQDLARAILLKRGISEDAISEWRDPATELAAIPWSSGMSDLKLRRMLKRRR